MNLNFDYDKVDPQYYFSSECVSFFFVDKLLEIKKKLVKGGNCRFYHKRDEECNSSFFQGWGVK